MVSWGCRTLVLLRLCCLAAMPMLLVLIHDSSMPTPLVKGSAQGGWGEGVQGGVGGDLPN